MIESLPESEPMLASLPELNQQKFASCLYEGFVTHRRHVIVDNEFRYRIFQVYLDLDEIPQVLNGHWLWSSRWLSIAQFRRTDHLGDPQIPLKQAVQRLVCDAVGKVPNGPIRLLTNLRYYGFQMNPVSFYYCFNLAGTRVETVVAEVHNTPWGEEHCYVMPWPEDDPKSAVLSTAKAFHVSPFLPIDMEYRWRIGRPAAELTVHIQNYNQGELAFDVGLTMTRLPWTAWNRNTRLLKYPSMTMKVFAAIYWQAARLWWNGAIYHPHPRTLQPAGQQETT